jgi:hypothetical protein
MVQNPVGKRQLGRRTADVQFTMKWLSVVLVARVPQENTEDTKLDFRKITHQETYLFVWLTLHCYGFKSQKLGLAIHKDSNKMRAYF